MGWRKFQGYRDIRRGCFFCRRGGQFSVCILTALFDMLFVMIQRYNRQRIMKLVNRDLWRDFLNFPYFTGFPAP
ncbi:hypothetical protein [Roseburia intestinalis]|uniref:glycosyl-4,4'-diaponeurosporenoate acyltransferase CrtO family protein n=1 Tax=Roseburia intestinalis TaxID=166486 RepID=UPI003A7F22B6